MVVDKRTFAEVLREATHGRSVRSLAERTGWGRTTVHEWLSGVRLPSARQVEDLLGAVDASPPLLEEIQQLRNDAESTSGLPGGTATQVLSGAAERTPDTTKDTPDARAASSSHVVGDGPGSGAGADASAYETSSAPPGPSEAVSKTGRRLSRPLLAVLLGLVAAAGYLAGFATPRGEATEQSTATGPPSAHVQGTLGLGLVSHRGPDGATERVGSLYDGQVVHIACISPTGSRVEDDTMHESRNDWALLTDGTWVSVLYLDVHHQWAPPQPPPPPFTVC